MMRIVRASASISGVSMRFVRTTASVWRSVTAAASSRLSVRTTHFFRKKRSVFFFIILC
jgi:hypothetical protein